MAEQKDPIRKKVSLVLLVFLLLLGLGGLITGIVGIQKIMGSEATLRIACESDEDHYERLGIPYGEEDINSCVERLSKDFDSTNRTFVVSGIIFTIISITFYLFFYKPKYGKKNEPAQNSPSQPTQFSQS